VGTLYLVSTPIGNLDDISLRALQVLKDVALIASEDTRHTRKLLSHYGIHTRQVSYHEHSSPASRRGVLNALERGDVALVTDAGTPGLSDPGIELVRAAVDRGYAVRPIPGPSAVMAALVSSGLPTEGFLFAGYLPRRPSERQRFLEELASHRGTVVTFEVPHRLRATLSDLVSAFGGDRPVAVCREMTKLHEEIIRGTLREASDHFQAAEPRGEFTLVIGGAPQIDRWSAEAVRLALRERMRQGGSPSQVAREVAELSGWRRNDVYRIALEER
jgi:16S rRNA (cytidine1402-2'-O)-methyltransferase